MVQVTDIDTGNRIAIEIERDEYTILLSPVAEMLTTIEGEEVERDPRHSGQQYTAPLPFNVDIHESDTHVEDGLFTPWNDDGVANCHKRFWQFIAEESGDAFDETIQEVYEMFTDEDDGINMDKILETEPPDRFTTRKS